MHMFAGLGSPAHLIILLLIILLLFGAKRLPEMGRSLGQGIKEFKEVLNAKDAPEERRTEAVEDAEKPRAKAAHEEEQKGQKP
jgi:sec-independent protein translocase protein TatA